MKTWHIHISGIVQGVGFRPYIFQLATRYRLNGFVNNTNDGVHIEINTCEKEAKHFLEEIINHPPPLSEIIAYTIKPVEFIDYKDFRIVESEGGTPSGLLISPDMALCRDCREELHDPADRRSGYPFITCTNCGPRYSIITKLPYDRPHTTMAGFTMCPECLNEYNNPLERRHFSQTNSCPGCRIHLQWYENGILTDDFHDLDKVTTYWQQGKIIAIKGIGGYLLTCDATNTGAVKRLRKLKNRPSKPFALIYGDLYELAEDTEMNIGEKLELESRQAPIVLLYRRPHMMTDLPVKTLNPGLDTLGVMLPYTPLYDILLKKFRKPIVATSGNLSGETIVYEDNKAFEELTRIADAILSNDREIVVPQDDSVVRYTFLRQQRIVIRRSRGWAPSYINRNLKLPGDSILATGAMKKSTFGILNRKNIYLSQYLGNTANYDAEINYRNTYRHLSSLLEFKPRHILTDKHPEYFSTRFGSETARETGADLRQIQHHKAHFAAVLGEHNLFDTHEPVLGVVFDGTGYGDDGQIWGGEFFLYENHKIDRIHHLPCFPFITGDKMVREPRISLLCVAGSGSKDIYAGKFSGTEIQVYERLKTSAPLVTSSVGRLFDAAASLILDIDKQTYEGEAAMRLENAAYRYFRRNNFTLHYAYPVDNEDFPAELLRLVAGDLQKDFDREFLAAKFHITIAKYIAETAKKTGVQKVAFSGGVFQNAWLTEAVIASMGEDFELYFHRELSPNDENVSFGQIMYDIFVKN